MTDNQLTEGMIKRQIVENGIIDGNKRVVIRYRVECNFGSRYFENGHAAATYFNKCASRHFDVELWFVKYIYDSHSKFLSATQALYAHCGSRMPKG